MTQSNPPQEQTILRVLTELNKPPAPNGSRWKTAFSIGSTTRTMDKVARMGYVSRAKFTWSGMAYRITEAGVRWLSTNAPKEKAK